MMTDEQRELARRLVVCEQWEWQIGMSVRYRDALPPMVILNVEDDGPGLLLDDGDDDGWEHCDGYTPDLSDYATAAILLRMALEAEQNAPAHFEGHGWWLLSDPMRAFDAPSDADLGTAAARALLALWEDDDET